eukprot:CAMPEP_0170505248 /NCGR_PEP_ID=MMETSP0208-20121228/50323_1 /TAXON_ID=197538 /ORGANISM="Strombidium inclinatum, Strain S3" /LENGTH=112 /DNA_ID=CAMNT_0010786003 /DNA_START=373 /DNA_END=711 /DNA_ORIENTATION=-
MYELEKGALRYLFPAHSSYPLSPDDSVKKAKLPEDRLAKEDLLKIVMAILGDQKSHDLSFITRDSTKKIVKSCYAGKNRINFLNEFEGSPTDLGLVLQNSLRFNPYFRFSAS